MKDVTATSFGLLIGFLLPGLATLYALTAWSPTLKSAFTTIKDAKTDLALFVLVLLTALAAGLMVSLVRWLLFECWVCRSDRIGLEYFTKLGASADKLSAFREAVDQHYRYHQFWGGMAVVMPLLCVGWLKTVWSVFTLTTHGFFFLLFLATEALTIYGAIVAYRNYVQRSTSILGAVELPRGFPGDE